MSRLPTVSGDNGTWGVVLNDFLSVSHQTDGTLLASAVTTAGAYAKPVSGIPKTDLSSTVQTTLSNADTAFTSKADDTTVVHNTGNETVAGTKTFSIAPTLPLGQALAGTSITSVQQITAAAYAALGTPSATTLYVVVG